MPSRRDCFPREFPPLSVPSTRVLIRHPISANPLDGLFPIDWMWMMTAQERKDFRRVQKSRDIWKKWAVRLKGCTKMALTPLQAASNLALQASDARDSLPQPIFVALPATNSG